MSWNPLGGGGTPLNDGVDFDDIVRLAKDKVRRVTRIPGLGGKGLGLIAVLVVIAWGLTGIYKVQPDEQGVVLRFGKWVETSPPGLHVPSALSDRDGPVAQGHPGQPAAAWQGGTDGHAGRPVASTRTRC